MNFIFLGCGDIAAQCINFYFSLPNKQNTISAVIGDDKLRQICKIHNLPFIQTSDKSCDKELLISLIENEDIKFVVSVQYPWILSKDILDRLPSKFFNIHNAKLPEYKGHHTLSYEIINKEKFHFSTLHIMEERVDEGYIVKTRKIDIKDDETALSLWVRSAKECLILFEWLLINPICKININNLEPVGKNGHYYSRTLIDKEKLVSSDASEEKKDRYARAFHFPPYEPAYYIQNKQKIYLKPKTSDN